MILRTKLLCIATSLALLMTPASAMDNSPNKEDKQHENSGLPFKGSFTERDMPPDLNTVVGSYYYREKMNRMRAIPARKEFEKLHKMVMYTIPNMPVEGEQEKQEERSIEYPLPGNLVNLGYTLGLRDLKGHDNWVSDLSNEPFTDTKGDGAEEDLKDFTQMRIVHDMSL